MNKNLTAVAQKTFFLKELLKRIIIKGKNVIKMMIGMLGIITLSWQKELLSEKRTAVVRPFRKSI